MLIANQLTQQISPLNDTPLLWVLGGIFFILGWVLISIYNFKGFASGITEEVRSVNNTLNKYLDERREHDKEVRGEIVKLDGKIGDVERKVDNLTTQHDMVFRAGKLVAAHSAATGD